MCGDEPIEQLPQGIRKVRVLVRSGGAAPDPIVLPAPLRRVVYAELAGASSNLEGWAIQIDELPGAGTDAASGAPYWRFVADAACARTPPQRDNAISPPVNLRAVTVRVLELVDTAPATWWMEVELWCLD